MSMVSISKETAQLALGYLESWQDTDEGALSWLSRDEYHAELEKHEKAIAELKRAIAASPAVNLNFATDTD